MNAKDLLNEIFSKNLVFDQAGNQHTLDSNIDQQEGAFLMKLIREHQPTKTIEIGCAYGISSLFICSELQNIPGSHHTIIDPCQTQYFNNTGLTNLRKAHIDFFDLHEEVSEIMLPRLLSEGKKYDFCFIDGDHRFEHTLIDFFYLNKLIDIGGIIVLDDVGIPAINKMMRYVLNFPAYKQIGHVEFDYSPKRKIFDSVIKTPFRLLAKLFPQKLKHEFFSASVITSDKKLHLNSSMVALQKVKEDERTWDWYKEF